MYLIVFVIGVYFGIFLMCLMSISTDSRKRRVSMTCPICGGLSKVTDSRSDCEGVYRRRKCVECNHSFYTSEYESDSSSYNRIMYEKKIEHNKNITKSITKT